MSYEKVTIETEVPAPVEKVWRLWTEPQHITRWNFASPDWCCPTAENDLRVGGTYLARMEAKDGSFGFDFEAIYDEVVHHEVLAFTMLDGRQARTTFEALDGSTEVVTVFDAERENSIEMQREGWQAILDNFKAYVKSA
jgi:uncharacterized protein YndB with AHSA1/START domain